MKLGRINIRSPVSFEKREVKFNGQPIHLFLKGDGCPSGYVNLINLPEIQTAANRVADLVSSMTVQLMENTELGGDKRIKNELSRKVDVEPNRFCNHKEFYRSIVRNMILDGNGNAIVYPKHDRAGLLIDMIPFDMSQCSILPDARVRDQYGYRVIHKGVEYQPDDVLHFRANPDPQTPWIGTGFRVLLRDLARNLKQAQDTKQSFMENPSPTLAIAVDALTEDFDTPEGRDKVADRFLSETKDGKPWVVPAGLLDIKEIKPLSLSDIAINESVTIDKQMAASIFGVPSFLVGVGEFNKDTYNNFIRTTIRDYALIIQQEMTRKLLYDRNWYFRLNHRSLLAFDYTELINGGGQMVDRMAMDRNEYRDSVGLSPDEKYVDLLGLENYLPAEALAYQNKISGYHNQSQSETVVGGTVVSETETVEPPSAQQVTAVNKILESIRDGNFSKEAGFLWFKTFFPNIDEETIKKLIDGVNVTGGDEA